MLLKHFHLLGFSPGFVVATKNTAIKPSWDEYARMRPSILLWKGTSCCTYRGGRPGSLRRGRVQHCCLCTFDESWNPALEFFFNLYTHHLMNSGKMQSAEYSKKDDALLIPVFYDFLEAGALKLITCARKLWPGLTIEPLWALQCRWRLPNAGMMDISSLGAFMWSLGGTLPHSKVP